MAKPYNQFGAPDTMLPRLRQAEPATLVLWRKGMPQQTAFKVDEADGRAAYEAWKRGDPRVEVLSFPDGSGRRSTTVFRSEDLDGVTLEYATLRIAEGLNG